MKVFKGLLAFELKALKHACEGKTMPGHNTSRSTMTKADIIEKVYQKIGFSKKEASELVEMVFDQLKDVLSRYLLAAPHSSSPKSSDRESRLESPAASLQR